MKNKFKILINAEPFGFGPAAAVATFFEGMRENFETLSYIGVRHTLDLQKKLNYNNVYDVTNKSKEEVLEIIKKYDVLITALDFEYATIAKSLGKIVIIYDPLTWYWKVIPEIVKNSDIYISQNFYGVKERLESQKDVFPKKVKVISPIVSKKREVEKKEIVLINLGGLQNPFWSVDDVVLYAQNIINSLKVILKDEKVVVATSSAVSEKIRDVNVGSFSREKMFELLNKSKFTIMTSGLGNIYDAAKFEIPTLWLPPANDSQGQQLKLLKENNLVDEVLDWKDLGEDIDYFGNQDKVLKQIKENIFKLESQNLNSILIDKILKIKEIEKSKTRELLNIFGFGGTEEFTKVVFNFLNEYDK